MKRFTFNAITVACLLSAGCGQQTFKWGDPLERALWENQTEDVLRLIDSRHGMLDAVQRHEMIGGVTDGFTPLHLAALNGNAVLIEELLKRGANVNSAANLEHGNGYTPLHAAAWGGRKEAVEVLLKHHANVNVTSRQEETPLRVAVAHGNVEIAKMLIAAGAGWDDFSAAAMGNHGFLDARAAAGVDVVASRDEIGRTPLHYAAICGQKDAAAWLIEHGASVDSEEKTYLNGHGETPLHAAVLHQRVELVVLLLKSHANPNAPGSGIPPLQMVDALPGDRTVRLARLLIERGADVNGKNWFDGSTALHHAVRNGNMELVKYLIGSGADVNAKCDLCNGINAPSEPSNDTPADWADVQQDGYSNVLDYLISKGGKPSKTRPPRKLPDSHPAT